MAPFYFPWQLLIILIQNLTVSVKTATGKISLTYPIEQTFLQNTDLISILEDVNEIGCWIYLSEKAMKNNGNETTTDKTKNQWEMQLSGQIGENSQKSHFFIPVLLSEGFLVDPNHQKYFSDGLSLAGRLKMAHCFINMFHVPLELQVGGTDPGPEPEDDLDGIIFQEQINIVQHTANLVFCCSFIDKDRVCTQHVYQALMPKFTFIFLEFILKMQDNLLLDGVPNFDADLQEKKRKIEIELQMNFLVRRFSTVLFWFEGKLLPVLLVGIIQKGEHQPVEKKISGVWFINHWNIFGDINTIAFPCSTNRTSKMIFTGSSKKCYSKVMANIINIKNSKNLGHGQIQLESLGKLSKFKTPADRVDTVNLATSLEGFLNSFVNDTWKYEKENTDTWKSQKLGIRIFKMTMETKGFDYLPLFWIVTGSNNYKFITSDSVYKMKSTLQIYTTPFQKEVWTLVFVSMATTVTVLLVIALVLKKNKSDSSKIWKIVIELCWWILRILLEQPDQEIPPGIQIHQIHQNFIKNGLKRAIRLILSVWLFMSLILTNGFRGIIKSDYLLDFPFSSDPKWNSSMDFLKDVSFLVYYAQKDLNCTSSTKDYAALTFNLTQNWVNLFDGEKPLYLESVVSSYGNKLFKECALECPEQNLRRSFENSGCQNFGPCRELYKSQLMLSQQDKVCNHQIPELILNKLRHPKTVFMTTVQDFPFYWNHFKNQMKKHPELNMKFIHNEPENDEEVQEITGFCALFGVARNEPNLVFGPLKILLSSGIFWWWEKWDQIKFHGDRQIQISPNPDLTESGPGFIEESVPEFKPLSFQDSDVHLIFQIWLLFLILPSFCFVVEISFKWIRLKFYT